MHHSTYTVTHYRVHMTVMGSVLKVSQALFLKMHFYGGVVPVYGSPTQNI